MTLSTVGGSLTVHGGSVAELIRVTVNAATNGTTSGTSATITCPTRTAGDKLLLILSRNQAEASAFTYDAGVSSAQEVANAGPRRLLAVLVTTMGSPASFVVTSPTLTASVWTWYCASVTNIGTVADVPNAASAIGSSTTSAVEVPVVTGDFVATGNEVAFGVAGVNADATWTSDVSTIFATTSGNGAMMIDAKSLAVGKLSAVFGPFDRGNNGSARNESALSFILQGAPQGRRNLLTNPSFETAVAGLATGWTDEHTTATQPTYALVASPVDDGGFAQQISYTGAGGDSSAKAEIYQAPISASPGNVLTFKVKLAGTLTRCSALIGVEAFTSGAVYISEQDTYIPSLTGTLTEYSVQYTCPAGTSYVAAYLQIPGVGSTSAFTVQLDTATLTVS